VSDEKRLLEKLGAAPVVPLVQAEDPQTAIAITQALVAGGLEVVEVVLRTDEALNCLREVALAVPDALVGAGTVLSAEQARASIAAGARFIVSPGLHPEVVAVAQEAGLPVFPGVATASEIQLGWNLGLRHLKFFPASLAGGPAMLKALGSAYRDVQFMPTGGISAGNLPDYLALPNVLACGGSWITPKAAIEAGDFETVTRLAAEAVAIARSVRAT
jgi:2-dehydro-3-deoxyphosphogluconate aldolase/(4S)-4-hydroxy-2-oxoglutarate aldolase